MLQTLKSKRAALAACGTLLSMVAVQGSASAAPALPQVTFALEVQSVSGDSNAVYTPGGSSVTVSTTNAVVTVGLYAIISGYNGDTQNSDYAVTSAVGSAVGPSSGLLGNFTVGAQANGFGGTAYRNGNLVNSNNTSPVSYNLGDDTTDGVSPSTSADDFYGISSSTGGTSAAALDGNGNADIELGTTTFTLLSTDSSGTAVLQFIPNTFDTANYPHAGNKNQIFKIAGTTYTTEGNGYTSSSNQALDITEQGLNISFVPTPEPTSLSLLGLGGLAMMRRRTGRRLRSEAVAQVLSKG